MAVIVMSDRFTKRCAQLEPTLKKQVLEMMAKVQQDPASNGARLKPLTNSRDRRVRTARVTDNYRAVLMHPGGETYYLVEVLPHDDALAYATNVEFSVNPVHGGVEYIDRSAVEALTPALDESSGTDDRGESLLSPHNTKTLVQLGMPEDLAPLCLRITEEAELDALARALPKLQATVLTGLAVGLSPEQVWEEVAAESVEAAPIDTQDFEAALTRPTTQTTFAVAETPADAQRIVEESIEAWRIFLHPLQRKLAYEQRWNGPARLTGGPGTGKTVVAMHRARALAERMATTERSGQRILFTTFTRTLAEDVQRNLELLGGKELLDKVDVLNVDRLAMRLVNARRATRVRIINEPELQDRCNDVLDSLQLSLSVDGRFLAEEWSSVILAGQISSRDDYLKTSRRGRGRRLDRLQRADIWRAVEELTRRLDKENLRTFPQLAAEAADLLGGETRQPYDHVVVDEAQDLHAAHWRMVRALIPEGPDDIFLVGDAHQRIYDRPVVLSRLGIETRGRSRRLTLNYRTTGAILRWSLQMLTGETFDDLDAESDSLLGYRSERSGDSPVMAGHGSASEELQGLVAQVQSWLDSGVEPPAIAVAAREQDTIDEVTKALGNAGIEAQQRTAEGVPRGSVVHVSTMHRLKGLEYRCVAVVNASEGAVPLCFALPHPAEDPLAYDQAMKRERCLLYVACTRAREQLSVSWRGVPSPFLGPFVH